jgi:FtsH-binding integral membrane protein
VDVFSSAVRPAFRSKAGWAFGCVLAAAALGCHYTARYWYQIGNIRQDTPPVPYAAVLVIASLACGILLWHYVGRRLFSPSWLGRLLWCVGLGVAATAIIYAVMGFVLALSAVVYAGLQTGQNPLAMLVMFVMVLMVGALTAFVPALPYGVAAGAVFFLIAETRGWVRKP